MNEETKEKLRQANLGKNNSFYGRKHSEESKKMMSEQRRGRKHSEETKQRIRNSVIKSKNKTGISNQ